MGKPAKKPTIRILLVGSPGVGKNSLESRFTTMAYPPPYNPSLILASRRFYTLTPHPPSPTYPITRPLDTLLSPNVSTLSPMGGRALTSLKNADISPSSITSSLDPISAPDSGRTSGFQGPCHTCHMERMTYLVEVTSLSSFQSPGTRNAIFAKRDFDAVLLVYSVGSQSSLLDAEKLHNELPLRCTSGPSGKERKWFGRKNSSEDTSMGSICGSHDREVVVALLGTKSDIDESPGDGPGLDIDSILARAKAPHSSQYSMGRDSESEADVRSMETVHPLFRSSRASSVNNNPISPGVPPSSHASSLRPTRRASDRSVQKTLLAVQPHEQSSSGQLRGSGSGQNMHQNSGSNIIRGLEPQRHSDPLRRSYSIQEERHDEGETRPEACENLGELRRSESLKRRRPPPILRRAASVGPLPLSPMSPLMPPSPGILSSLGSPRSPRPKRFAATETRYEIEGSRASPLNLGDPHIASFDRLGRSQTTHHQRKHASVSTDGDPRRFTLGINHRIAVTEYSRISRRTASRSPTTPGSAGKSPTGRSEVKLSGRRSKHEAVERWLEWGTPALADKAIIEGENGSEGADDKVEEGAKASREEREVSRIEAEVVAHRLMLGLPAMECSAKTGEGVEEAFDTVIREVLSGMGIKLAIREEGLGKKCAHRLASGEEEVRSGAAVLGDVVLPPNREPKGAGQISAVTTTTSIANMSAKTRKQSLVERIKRMFGGQRTVLRDVGVSPTAHSRCS